MQLFNNIFFFFQRKGNNALTGLVLQEGEVSGVAVKNSGYEVTL